MIISNFGQPSNFYFQIKSNRPKKKKFVEQRNKQTLDKGGKIDDEIVNDDVKIREIFNRFFSNPVSNLKTPDFQGAARLADNICHLIFRAILKYANHTSTFAIIYLNNTLMFSFSNVSAAINKMIIIIIIIK